MADIQIAVIDEKDTQIALAVPGIQGPAGAISSGGSANQVFYKVSGTNYDAGWTFIGNANVDAAAAIAGTKISPNFGSQAIVTTGTNTAASFIPTSATIPSNGIYLPGANQVAVATNGTGRLFVDANGRVGVGISPGKTIDAYVTGTTQATLRLSDVDSRNVELRSPSPLGSLAGVGTVSSHDFTFFINNTERARLDTSGRLGLGTSSPNAQSQLHVVGSGYQLLYLNTTNAGGGGATFFRSDAQALYVGTAGSSWLTGSSTADGLIRSEANLIFAIGNSEKARIDTSGRLLVGTSQSTGAGELLRVEKASTGSEGAGIRLAGTFSLVNDGTQTISVGNGCLVFVSDNTTGDGGLFFCSYRSATVTLISDPNNRYANAVTAGRISLTKSADSVTATVTNKGGSSYTFTVGKINCSD